MANKIQLDALLNIGDVKINQTVFQKISQSVAGLAGAAKNFSDNFGKANTQAQGLNTTLKKTGDQISNNEKVARLFLQRMAQFAILLPTFATLNRAIQGGVKFLFEFDSILSDVVRTDPSKLKDRMEEIGDAALKTSTEFGVMATEVLEVTKVFVQAGLTIEDSQKRAELAILATQVSTLKSADAVEFFISAANQFRLSNEELTDSLDALVKVEDAAAVEAQDIAEAFRTGGNSFAEFAKDINTSIAIITGLREQTRKSGREIGTFFKTFATRAFAAGDARDAIESLGVTVENLDGSLRPALDVINDLAKSFEGLTEAQQANAGKAIAGVRQYESFLALLKSTEKINNALAIANNSAGTAQEKRLISDAKLERQLGKLIAQGQAFAEALGDAGFEDTIVKALNAATKLLDVFTKTASVVSEIGGSITPLLALGAIQLGRGVFGFGGQKSEGPFKPDKNFIGPLTPSQQAVRGVPLGEDFKKIGSIIGNTGQLFGKYTAQLATGLTVSAQHGMQQNLNSQALKVHTQAIATNVKALAASAAGAITQRKVFTDTAAGLAGLTAASILLPKVFDSVSASLNKAGNVAGATLVDVTGNATTMAAQFAFLGPQAAGMAAIFGAVTSAGSRLISAWDDAMAALKEILQRRQEIEKTENLETRILGTPEAQGQVIKSFADAIKKIPLDARSATLTAPIENAFKEISTSASFKDLQASSENLRDIFYQDVKAIEAVVLNNSEYIASLAESNGRTEEFTKLQQGLSDGTIKAGMAMTLFIDSLRKTGTKVNEIITRTLSFEEFKEAQDVIDLAEGIKQLNLEFELAKMGPEALADELVKMEQALLLTRRAAEQTEASLRDRLNASIRNLGDVGTGPLKIGGETVKFQDLLKDLLAVPQTLDPEPIAKFQELIRGLPKAQQEAGEEILKVVEEQIQNRKDLQDEENDVLAAQTKRRKAFLDEEVQATNNALAASMKFTAELKKFGDAVNTDVLATFQNLNLSDVEGVLGGTSELSEGIQQLIMSAFADPVTQAEQALKGVAAATEAELSILASKLDLVKTKLAEEADASQHVALLTEQHALELEIETTIQRGAIDATNAKIKVLEAEKTAAEDAAKAEKERLEAIEKLADASRAFDKELRDVRREFEDFSKQKIADLLGEEEDARSQLKDAQQESLEATQSLADAYMSLTQAQLEFNGVLAEARIKNQLLSRDIAQLTGGIVTFDDNLSTLNDAFRSVLTDANITLQKRIDLERQLAEETLSFLQQARDSIVQAGIGIFGQTGTENQALGQGIAGLQFVADQLGGSFESFLNLTRGELKSVSEVLLGLPVEFRQQILDALSFLPSTTNIGGFNVEQLRQAIGQVGAGVAPGAGLPSIEELNTQQVEQLTRLQELALQDAQLQFSQVVAAQEQVAAAQEAAEAAKLLQERAEQNLVEVRNAVLAEKAVLDLANQQRNELLNAVVAADDKNTLLSIEKQAQAFADQNSVFREVGDSIVQGIGNAIGARLAVLEAAAAVPSNALGYVPNFGNGNLSPAEAAGLLRAGAREKRAMPGGAKLAVANTHEAIIPMRNRGFVPNFQEGNSISAGISAIKQINETVVAAIARSVTTALSDLNTGGGQTTELLTEIMVQLRDLNNTLEEVSVTNTQIQTNTSTATGGTAAPVAATAGGSDVTITLQTNQNSSIRINGLEDLRAQIAAAVREAASKQVDEQLAALLQELDNIITALQERGLLSSIGSPR